MLDIKQFLDRRGLQSDGFRMTLDKLAEIGVPAIALINTGGYRHFVVIKGVEAERILVADRSEEHTSELQSLMRISYAVFCLKKKNKKRMLSQQHNQERCTHIRQH